MKKKSSPATSANYFDEVIANATDFFHASIKQIENKPKYSVINFCAGLELILKARLLAEHWSLIVAKPETAELAKFINGDFQSVNMEMAIQRLKGVCGEVFTDEEIRCYKMLRDHRNRLVHFCHPDYTQKSKPKLLEQIAGEQCRAWRLLHRRLNGPWKKVFKNYKTALDNLDRDLHNLRIFLRSKFESLREGIRREKAKGTSYKRCSACGFESLRVKKECPPVYRGDCSVCSTTYQFLRLTCAQCGKSSDIEDITVNSCSNAHCSAHFSIASILSEYVPRRTSSEDSDGTYYCALCESYEPCALSLSGEYFCLSCMQWVSSAKECENCGCEIVEFDPSDSGFSGCYMCEEAATERLFRD